MGWSHQHDYPHGRPAGKSVLFEFEQELIPVKEFLSQVWARVGPRCVFRGKLAYFDLGNNANSSPASQSDWQKARTDWANGYIPDQGCFDTSRMGAVYPMARTGYGSRGRYFLNIPEYQSGRFICFYTFPGKLLF